MSTFRSVQVCLIALMGLMVQVAGAEVAVDISGQGKKIDNENGSSVNSNSKAVGSDVQMDGIAVINDEVFIDGEQVPRGKTLYTSRKSGKSYRIQWGKDGNISVAEK